MILSILAVVCFYGSASLWIGWVIEYPDPAWRRYAAGAIGLFAVGVAAAFLSHSEAMR